MVILRWKRLDTKLFVLNLFSSKYFEIPSKTCKHGVIWCHKIYFFEKCFFSPRSSPPSVPAEAPSRRPSTTSFSRCLPLEKNTIYFSKYANISKFERNFIFFFQLFRSNFSKCLMINLKFVLGVLQAAPRGVRGEYQEWRPSWRGRSRRPFPSFTKSKSYFSKQNAFCISECLFQLKWFQIFKKKKMVPNLSRQVWRQPPWLWAIHKTMSSTRLEKFLFSFFFTEQKNNFTSKINLKCWNCVNIFVHSIVLTFLQISNSIFFKHLGFEGRPGTTAGCHGVPPDGRPQLWLLVLIF